MPNETLIHADIFFFISTIALALISIGIIIALYYLIKILRNARDISDAVRLETRELVADVKKLRANLRDEGMKWKHVADLVRTFFVRKGSAVKKTAEKMTDKLIK